MIGEMPMAVEANYCFVTQIGEQRQRPQDIMEAWADGNEFRVYQFATIITVNDTTRLRMAGFTHVRVVYQRDDLSVSAVDIDLKRYAS